MVNSGGAHSHSYCVSTRVDTLWKSFRENRTVRNTNASCECACTLPVRQSVNWLDCNDDCLSSLSASPSPSPPPSSSSFSWWKSEWPLNRLAGIAKHWRHNETSRVEDRRYGKLWVCTVRTEMKEGDSDARQNCLVILLQHRFFSKIQNCLCLDKLSAVVFSKTLQTIVEFCN